MNRLLIVDRESDWTLDIPGVQVISARDYLTLPPDHWRDKLRVYNLCRSFAYQSSGYYVSLLAGARGHVCQPDTTAIQDFKLAHTARHLADEIETSMQRSLRKLSSKQFRLNVYFGRSASQRHAELARSLYAALPAPLLQAVFVLRRGTWTLRSLSPLAIDAVPPGQLAALQAAATAHLTVARPQSPRRARTARYDLALLIDRNEAEPPSNAAALKRFRSAAEKLDMTLEPVDRNDYGRIAEYDGLFIRETTAVHHHTYRLSRRAAWEGLVVIDDPMSILRCTNKVFQAQLMDRKRIPTPRTLIVHRGNADQVEAELGLPCVLKQPDSAFSQGVIKVGSREELRTELRRLLSRSEMIVAQAFEPTEYDWRIGVLNGEALYACRYFMAPEHWQIYHRPGEGRVVTGEHETVPVEDAPDFVVRTAVRAARAIGDGLYGVDLKQHGKRCRVIEVNDNPNIDHGVEDQVLGDALYERVMGLFLQRIENRGRRRPRA